MSGTLLRSVAKLYASLFFGLLLGVLLIFLVGDFGDRLRVYLDKPLTDVGLLYFYKLQVAVQQLTPAAMLLAASAAVSVLRKRGEWTGMQSLGLGRGIIVVPVLVVTGCSALGLIAFDDAVATRAGVRVDRMLVERFQTWGDYRFFYFPRQWFRVGPHVFYVRGQVDEAGEVSDASVFEMNEDFSVVRRIDAALWKPQAPGLFLLEHAVERRFLPDGTWSRTEAASMALSLPGVTKETFAVRVGRPEYMRVSELLAQRQIRKRVGLATERIELALHNRFAYPLAGAVAAVLAALLALRPGRRGHLTAALLEGLLVAVALFSLQMVTRALAVGEHLPPAVAAWGPLLVLGLACGAAWRGFEAQRASARR